MKRILVVFGTRPEAIKMAPVINLLKSRHQDFKVIVCVTGQHRDLLDEALRIFNIVADEDLNLMKPDQTLYDTTTGVLSGMKVILERHRPDMVLVHGDTTTTFSTSLAAFYQKITVCHVEAGLRTADIYSPFPEEINRRLTSSIARFHFAPTRANKENLLKEGFNQEHIMVTGNTVIDALHQVSDKLDIDIKYRNVVVKEVRQAGYELSDRTMVLITAHRRENFGEGMENIANAIAELSNQYPGTDWVYPVHPNPNVKNIMQRKLLGIDNVFLLEPLGYEAFVLMMKQARILLTDSGGIQEEAPSLGVPVLVLRDNTERPEAVSAGTVKLIGTGREQIVLAVKNLLDDSGLLNQMSEASNPYGDGNAAKRIADFLAVTE